METPVATQRLLAFIDAAPTPYHAVAEARRRLVAAGFVALREEEPWSLAPAGRYLVVRGGSSLVAFVVGDRPPGEAGFRWVGAHTDSPNLRLKPRADHVREGYRQLGVEVYGGVLLHTWLDRDLALAGRLVLADREEPLLLRIQRPVARIPNIAIHLNREVNEKGLVVNRQTHLPPVVGLAGEAGEPGWLKAALAREAGVHPDAILGFDLMLHDAAPSAVGGLDGELIFAPRLDNLASCHAALEALLDAPATAASTRGLVLYDNEEVGSESAEGAQSPFLLDVFERIALATGGGREDLMRARARSLFVSADMAHAVHPAFTDRHEPQHMPRLNAGPVIKVNASLRYATTGVTAARFEALARAADVPVQVFVNRTDLACGTTIGPITAARAGIPTVDVGNPMLSMHSIREMAGAADHGAMIAVLTKHYT